MNIKRLLAAAWILGTLAACEPETIETVVTAPPVVLRGEWQFIGFGKPAADGDLAEPVTITDAPPTDSLTMTIAFDTTSSATPLHTFNGQMLVNQYFGTYSVPAATALRVTSVSNTEIFGSAVFAAYEKTYLNALLRARSFYQLNDRLYVRTDLSEVLVFVPKTE